MTGGESFWLGSTRSPGYAPLAGDCAGPIAVVGGGIVGMTTALLLKQAGHGVLVLEADEVGSGVTGHTTGKLTAGQTLAYSKLEHSHDTETAKAYAESQTAGVELVFRLAESIGIDCDLERVANYVYAEHEDEIELLERERDAARRAGLEQELLVTPDAPVSAAAALRLDNQGQVHARKYVLGLAAELQGDGSSIHERTRVTRVERGTPHKLHTDNGVVHADHVVLATNAPITMEGLFFARALPWRGYAVAAPATGRAPDGMWINVGSPTRSIRSTPLADGRRLVLVVGEGHRAGQDSGPQRYDALASYLGERFGLTPEYAWSTQDQYSVDGLPFVGSVGGPASRLYVATGFGGWGLTNGSMSGLLLSDLILGRDNPWAQLFDPDRSSLRRSPVQMAKDNANVAWHLIEGKVRRSSGSIADVAPGDGRIVDVAGSKAAVHRDADGAIHAVSAACTHLGCTVAWNAAERSWDCPCHGSRFAVDGTVLHGPATEPLEAIDVEAGARG